MTTNVHEPYNELQAAAELAGPGSKEAYDWMRDLLNRISEHWQRPETELPHVDLFDEVQWALLLESK